MLDAVHRRTECGSEIRSRAIFVACVVPRPSPYETGPIGGTPSAKIENRFSGTFAKNIGTGTVYNAEEHYVNSAKTTRMPHPPLRNGARQRKRHCGGNTAGQQCLQSSA